MYRVLAGAVCALAIALGSQNATAQPAGPAAPEPDTTGPLNKPMIVEIAANTYLINEFGADSMYLVIGKTRALAIDSGSGFFDYKGTIESLTKLPYDVAITHGHPDHAGGIGQFDAVYMDPADTAMAKNISYEGRVRYGKIMRATTDAQLALLGISPGFANVWGYNDSNVRKWDRFPEIKPLHDGMVFDLGGRKVTVYHIGNHTPGSSIFLDDKSRIIFTGDVANINVGANDSVSSVLRGLLRIRKLETKFDQIYTGHTAYANAIQPLSEPLQVLDDLIENFRSVLRGNPVLKTMPNRMAPGRDLSVAVHGSAYNAFNPDKLWEPGEKHTVP